MNIAKTTLINIARAISEEKLYGDLDYYVDKVNQRNKVVQQLCNFIIENDKEIDKIISDKDREIRFLKSENEKIFDKFSLTGL